MPRRTPAHREIYCKLTERDVTIRWENVELGTDWGTISNPAKMHCVDTALSCPRQCMYISGGNPFAIDPETGQQRTE